MSQEGVAVGIFDGILVGVIEVIADGINEGGALGA